MVGLLEYILVIIDDPQPGFAALRSCQQLLDLQALEDQCIWLCTITTQVSAQVAGLQHTAPSSA